MGPVAALVVLGLFAGACGDDEPDPGAEHPLTFDEAARLADVQFDNLDAGGALFEVASSFLTTGETLTMRGEVDWVAHTGRALVSANGTDTNVAEVYWTEDVVLERIPQLTDLLAARGSPGIEWVARPPETATRQLDRAIALLVALASETRSNPVLLQQEEGSAFLRFDVLRETDVEVLRFGMRNRYWLDVESGDMLRFDGDAEAGGAPIVIDVLDRGPRSIPAPDPATVVDVTVVDELYPAFVGSGVGG